MAGLARLRGLVLAQFLAHPRALGLEQPAVEVADDPLERLAHGVFLAPVLEGERNRAALGPEQDNVAVVLTQVVPRGGEVEAVFLRQAGEHLHVIGARRVGLGPRHHRALLQGQVLVRNHQLRVEQQLFAQPVARRARALRGVEAEQSRLDLLDREARDGTGELFGKHDAVGRQAGALHRAAGGILFLASRHHAVGQVDISQSFGELQRLLETVGQPRLDAVLHRDAIDHHLDVVLELLVERGGVLDRVHLAVDAHAGEARLLPFGQLLAVFALAPAHDRGEQVEPRPLGQGHHPVDHGRDGLRLDRQAGGGRIGHADPRPQQAHVVVDLGHGRDGTARVARGGLLLDRDRRGEPVDMLDIGLLHHLEELARVGRQALDIAPLPLGIDGVEREGRLAAARQAGDHDQAIARQIDIDPLEVVLARAADGDLSETHRERMFRKCSLRSRQMKASCPDVSGGHAMWGPRRGLQPPARVRPPPRTTVPPAR